MVTMMTTMAEPDWHWVEESREGRQGRPGDFFARRRILGLRDRGQPRNRTEMKFKILFDI